LVAQVAAIADDERRVLRERERHPIGAAPPQHELDAPFGERPGGLGQALEQERERALAGLRIALVEAESHHHGLAALVREPHGVLERGIVGGPLRLLHPVEHVRAGVVRRIVAQRTDARLLHAHSQVSFVSAVLSFSACWRISR
jgi:hypothetical protein